MTFEEWWCEKYPRVNAPQDGSFVKAAWDYQQTIIDELQYLTNLQQGRIDELEAKVEWLQSVINNVMLPEGYEIKQMEQE